MEELTRAEVIGVQGDTVWRMMEVTSGIYPTIAFVDAILDRKCRWKAVHQLFGTHVRQFVIMNMVKTTMKDGPICEVVFGERMVDDGREEGAKHLSFECVGVSCHGGVRVIWVIIVIIRRMCGSW